MTKTRCDWGTTSQLYIDYHDNEWRLLEQNLNFLKNVTPFNSCAYGINKNDMLKKCNNYGISLGIC